MSLIELRKKLVKYFVKNKKIENKYFIIEDAIQKKLGTKKKYVDIANLTNLCVELLV